MIGCIKNFSGNNGFMVILLPVLCRSLLFFFDLCVKKFGVKVFLASTFTTMALICQNTCKCTGIPLHTSQLRLTAILHQKSCNLRKRISIQVQVVNHLYRLCFLRVNYNVAFLVFIVSKQCRGQEQATADRRSIDQFIMIDLECDSSSATDARIVRIMRPLLSSV